MNFACQSSQKFPLQYMAIHSNENITKITKWSPHKFPHLVQNRKNICTQNIWRIQYPHSRFLPVHLRLHIWSWVVSWGRSSWAVSGPGCRWSGTPAHLQDKEWAHGCLDGVLQVGGEPTPVTQVLLGLVYSLVAKDNQWEVLKEVRFSKHVKIMYLFIKGNVNLHMTALIAHFRYDRL